jgi:hypothetical protein
VRDSAKGVRTLISRPQIPRPALQTWTATSSRSACAEPWTPRIVSETSVQTAQFSDRLCDDRFNFSQFLALVGTSKFMTNFLVLEVFGTSKFQILRISNTIQLATLS